MFSYSSANGYDLPSRIGKLRLESYDDDNWFGISVNDAKDHLRLDLNDDDNYIQSLIDISVAMIEQYTRRFYRAADYKVHLDQFPYDYIDLQFAGISEVTSVKYNNAAGTEVTLSSDDYDIDLKHEPARIYIAKSKTWPTTENAPNSVTISFSAGSDTTDNIEKPLVHAMKLLIGHFYENRQTVSDRVHYKMPMAIEYLINPYRILEL